MQTIPGYNTKRAKGNQDQTQILYLEVDYSLYKQGNNILLIGPNRHQ